MQTLTTVGALTSNSLPSEPTSRSEHDILRDEQKADPTLKKRGCRYRNIKIVSL